MQIQFGGQILKQATWMSCISTNSFVGSSRARCLHSNLFFGNEILTSHLIVFQFPVCLRNRLKSAGLEPVLSNTEKPCIASYYRQISTILLLFVSPGLRPLDFNLIIFPSIRGKLSIIRCDTLLLSHLLSPSLIVNASSPDVSSPPPYQPPVSQRLITKVGRCFAPLISSEIIDNCCKGNV